MTRATFIRSLAAAGAGALVGGCRFPEQGNKPKIALQLYSIHKIFWKTPEANLAALKAGGFDGVEFAGYGGRTAAEIRALLGAAGLAGAGTHVSALQDWQGEGLKANLAFCAAAGIASCTNPHSDFKTADEWLRFGEIMGRAAEAAAPMGIAVGLHTAYHHFTRTYGGKTAWDLIYSNTSPRLKQQIDTAQAFHTGQDLPALLKKYRGRHFSIHAKENVPTQDGVFGVAPTDGGKCVPWADVVRTMADEAGLKWWIVEAEGRPDSLEPAIACRKILSGWL